MRYRALLVVVLVVLAGCSGLSESPATAENPQATVTETDGTTDSTSTTDSNTTTETTATTTSDSPERVEVIERNAELGDVNATTVWHRVGAMMSVDGPDPPPVVVTSGRANRTIQVPPFWQSYGAEDYSFVWKSAGGFYNPGTERIQLERNAYTTTEKLEVVLAHEFAHVYYDEELDALPENASTFVGHAVNEGAVEYVTWMYADQYTNVTQADIRQSTFRDGRPYTRYSQGGYYLGAKYARNFSDSNEPITSMYENPPTTAEQVLHGLPPGSEPPRNLTVTVARGDADGYDVSNVRRRGEAVLRFVLEHGLSRQRASRAAAGWGDDRSLQFRSGDVQGFAWVIRWDSTNEAEEFEAAFSEFRANVSEPLAIQSIGNETTVVFSGDTSFVQNATASGTAGNVTVAP